MTHTARKGLMLFLFFSLYNALAWSQELEPNDSPSTANEIDLNGSINGMQGMSCPDSDFSEDYFRFVAPSDGTIVLSVEASNDTDFDQFIQLFFVNAQESNFDLLNAPSGMNGNTITSEHHACVKAGDNYLKVVPSQTTLCTSYALNISFLATVFGPDTEPNDGSADAISIELNNVYEGNLGFDGIQDYDFYSIFPAVLANNIIEVALEWGIDVDPDLAVWLVLEQLGTPLITQVLNNGFNGNSATTTIDLGTLDPSWIYYLYFYSNACGASYEFSVSEGKIIGLNDQEENLVNISPNPSSGIFRINGSDILEIRFFDSLSREVDLMDSSSNGDWLWDAGSFECGVYYAQIQFNDLTRSVVKLIKNQD